MPDPTTVPTPLADFTPEELSNKVHALLEDWHSPTLGPIGLCRLLDLNIAQIRAIMALPMFAAILADIRFIQNARREWIFACAAEHAFDRLLYISHQTPTNAATCKEIRLAAKAILEITGPPVGPTCSRPSESETPPMQSADSDAPQGHTHDESANRGFPESPSQRAPSVSDGVSNEPEASAPGLPSSSNQPRPAGSGSTTANESATPDDLHAATTLSHLQPAAPEGSGLPAPPRASATPQTPEPAPSGRG